MPKVQVINWNNVGVTGLHAMDVAEDDELAGLNMNS